MIVEATREVQIVALPRAAEALGTAAVMRGRSASALRRHHAGASAPYRQRQGFET
jgi:hypothetical protein